MKCIIKIFVFVKKWCIQNELYITYKLIFTHVYTPHTIWYTGQYDTLFLRTSIIFINFSFLLPTDMIHM